MIRQAQTYLVGALSGVTLIGIAIGVFVVLVSAQVFHEWPTADTSAQAGQAGLGPAKAVTAGDQAGAGGAAATATSGGANPVLRAGGTATGGTQSGGRDATGGNRGTAEATGPATAVESSPGIGGDAEGTATGDNGGSDSSTPSGSHPSQGGSPSSPGTTSSGGNPPSSSGGTTNSGSSGGSTGSSGSSGSSGGATGGETPVTAAKNPPPVSEAVNETVNGVDESALGGTLEKTGVSKVTEEVVTGAAGPETVVGQTVEGVTEAVGGLLGGNGSSGE